jgi:hypothetical protein
MPVALVQQAIANGAGSASPSLSGVVAGNALILVYGQPGTASPTYSATGYTSVVHYDNGRCQGVLVKYASAGGTENPTLTASSGTSQVYCWLLEVSGLETGTYVIPAALGITNASTTTGHHCAAATEIDTVRGAFLVGVGTLGGTSGGFTPATSWTALSAALVTTVNAQYYAAAGAQTDNRGTYSTVTSRGSQNTMVAFIEDNGGGNTTDARSGQFRSGQARSGNLGTTASWGFSAYVNEADQSTTFLKRTWSVQESLGKAPSSARFHVRGLTPTLGQVVEVYNGGHRVGLPYFRGRITELEPVATRKAGRVVYRCNCSDWLYDLDHLVVTARYDNLGVNSILARLLATYAPDFTVGYAPASLGTLAQIEFTNRTVSECITQLAERVTTGAYWTLDFNRAISIIPATESDPALGATVTVDDTTNVREVAYTEDLTETYTRILVVGGGGTTTALAGAGATTVAVDSLGWYSSTGGSAQAANQIFTYTGLSAASGAGTLTGVSGITMDIPQGTLVHPVSTYNATSAQTALSTLLGTAAGMDPDGIRTLVYSNGELDAEGVVSTAEAIAVLRSSTFKHCTWIEDDDPARLLRPGRTATVTLTQNIPVSITTGRIQSVTLTVKGDGAAQTSSTEQPRLERAVELSPLAQGLLDFLGRLSAETLRGL